MDFIRFCLGFDLIPCCNKKGLNSEIILEELKDPRIENNLITNKNESNNIIKINNQEINNSNNYSNSDHKEVQKEKTKKGTEIEKLIKNDNYKIVSFIETTQTFEPKIVSTGQNLLSQKNSIAINENNNLDINLNETHLTKEKGWSNRNLNLKLNYMDCDKSEIKNSQITNTTKVDSVNSIRREKEIESSFNAEFDKNFNSIGKVENKFISPILNKKKLEKEKIKKMQEVDSMREDLKKWAFFKS